MTHGGPLAAHLAPALQLSGVRLEAIWFTSNPGEPLWRPTYGQMEERPAGSPLAPGEEIFAEGEEQGQAIWLISALDGNWAMNSSRYGCTQLRLSCAAGSADALDALHVFLSASWLQALDDHQFLTALAEMTPGGGVNLREEGQAMRERNGEWVAIWPSYDRLPETYVRMGELSEITVLCLRFWHLRQRFKKALAAMTQAADQPTEDELPRYEAGRGFVNAERWS